MTVTKTKHGMSAIEGSIHWFLIIGTCGMWYPVYRLRKHSVDRTFTTIAS